MDAMESRHPSRPDAPAVRPMLRAVLLCDIAGSTAMVEKLGDARVAGFMQRHDQLLLQALKLCHGQLVDKADGVLALFERPIQALDFALRYQRGLYELGKSEGVELRARTGIHVGDVMTWANHPRDVQAGAKPIEVEGLAKPVAARLMSLAMPGQILMSGMAQNLSHRAVGELGERAGRLRWLVHGRYRFKGVPAPMLVHEVGEPGIAPLRAPESGAKAWRELPLWRRPPVIAAEALLLLTLGVGLLWTTFRSEPAIAFAERDWVVVADVQNQTDETLFDDALDTALRVGLEQSQHVNVFSDLRVDGALARMQRPGQPLDRRLAAELALREGARAVILPTVAQVGGVIRVSLEVIDPQSGVTVYSESADGRGMESVLPSLDASLVQVRSRLGEAMGAVAGQEITLEQATTGNIEALRALSLGMQARSEGRAADAKVLFEEAVKLDPGFAMAWLRLAFLAYVQGDAETTQAHLDQALAHRDRLTRRELIFLEGAEATLANAPRAVERFRLLASLYPDDFRAKYNEAYFAHFDLLRPTEARRALQGTDVSQNAARVNALYLDASVALALGETERAVSEFERAMNLGHGGNVREYVDALTALRRHDEARRIATLQAPVGIVWQDIESRYHEASLPLDQGDWPKARAAVARLRADGLAAEAPAVVIDTLDLMAFSLRVYAPDESFGKDLRDWALRQSQTLEDSGLMLRRQVIFRLLAGAWMAANTGDVELARKLLDTVSDEPQASVYPANAAMARVVQAELALAEGRPSAAIAVLSEDIEKDRAIYFSRAVLLRALVAAGDHKEAVRMATWLAENRGIAFGEPTYVWGWQLANVAESTLALQTLAKVSKDLDPVRADKAAKAFSAAWPRGEAFPEVVRRDGAP